jgi:hypothetical protein
MLRGLDWDTSARKINIADHWRLLICTLGGSTLATLIWHAFFPHTLWFTKLWTGFSTGMSAGMIPGTMWQLHADKRRSITSGWFIVMGVFGWGLFACISLILWAPDLHAQEQERSKIRSLVAADISAIFVRLDDQRTCRIEDAATIASFVHHTKEAELFYPSHEGSARRLEIAIFNRDGTSLQYDGRVPERHQNDFSLGFRGYFVWTEIIIPGGRQWLDSVCR